MEIQVFKAKLVASTATIDTLEQGLKGKKKHLSEK